jgi:hypothetical protein
MPNGPARDFGPCPGHRATGTVLLPAFLPELPAGPGETAPVSPPGGDLALEAFIGQRLGPASRDLYAAAHGQLDRFLLPRVPEYTRGNQHQAARLLGIARQTLRLKLRDLGLSVAHAVEVDEDGQPWRGQISGHAGQSATTSTGSRPPPSRADALSAPRHRRPARPPFPARVLL